MEEAGEIPAATREHVPALSTSLIGAAELLVEGIDSLGLDIVNELQLLTLGPQLRGSENTRIGQRATVQVFEMIKQAVRPYLKEATRKTLIVLFNLDALLGGRGDEARRFREMLCSSVGIPV